MASSSCRACGVWFTHRRGYERLCDACYKADRQREQTAAERRAFEAGVEAGVAAAPSIPAALLKDLLTLVHPDRQPPERFETANRVTARLLELRA